MSVSDAGCISWKRVGTNVKASGKSKCSGHEGHAKVPREVMAVWARDVQLAWQAY